MTFSSSLCFRPLRDVLTLMHRNNIPHEDVSTTEQTFLINKFLSLHTNANYEHASVG